MTADKLYITSYRLVLTEIAPDFSLTRPSVGIKVETASASAPAADGTVTVNRTEKPATAPSKPDGTDGAGNPVTDGTLGREDLDSDAIRNPDGTIEIREEFFDGVQSQWRTDGYVLTADHAQAGDGHQYELAYGSGASGTVTYDVPDPMGVQRGGDVGLFRVPRSSITGVLWNDAFFGSADARTYNGIRDSQTVAAPDGTTTVEEEPGIAGEAVLITQWY